MTSLLYRTAVPNRTLNEEAPNLREQAGAVADREGIDMTNLTDREIDRHLRCAWEIYAVKELGMSPREAYGALDGMLDGRNSRRGTEVLEAATRLIRDFTDPDPCWFDHNGGCQAHGYLSLQPGELCPHAEAKRDWLGGSDQ